MRFLSRSTFTHIAQGLLMGGADIIPGVSGGTMALIVGIYERLIEAISALSRVPVALLGGDWSGAWTDLRSADWALLLPLGLGIGSAILIGAQVIPPLLAAYPILCRALFFGLIAGSVAIPWQRMQKRGLASVGIAAASAVAAFVLVGLPPRTLADPALWQVFGAAAIAICAMILPGISGAFLLLVLGMYEATLNAIRARDLVFIATFGLGAAAGLGGFSRLLDHLLSRHHDRTMAALVGLMIGSLRALWPWLSDDRALQLPASDDPVLAVFALAAAGFAFVFLLNVWALRQNSHVAA